MKNIICVITALLLAALLFGGTVCASAADTDASQYAWLTIYAPKALLGDYTKVTAYIYEEGGDEIFGWGTKSCDMTEVLDDYWTYDFAEHGVSLSPGKTYGVIFTLDWKSTTNPLTLDEEHANATAIYTGVTTSGSSDSQKTWQVKWESDDTGDDMWFYFEADPDVFSSYETITAYIYAEGGEGVYPWGSSQYNMEALEDNIWRYSAGSHSIALDPDKTYYVVFTGDWKDMSNPLKLSENTIGETAKPTGNLLSGNADGNKTYEVRWEFEEQQSEKPAWNKRSDGKLYFYADPSVFPSVDGIRVFIGEYDAWIESLTPIKDVAMQAEPEANVWSYDAAADGLQLSASAVYYVSFQTSLGETMFTPIAAENLGDLAYPVKEQSDEETEIVTVYWTNEQPDAVKGDVGGDGELNIQDVTLLQRHLAEFAQADGTPIVDETDPVAVWVADFDGNGNITVQDVTAMQRAIAEYAV